MNFGFTHFTLFVLLVITVYSDIAHRKIPNKITMPAILTGIIWSTVNSGLDGFLFSLLGFLIGFTVFLIPYTFGGIGAGDVKLMAAIGALMGWRFTLVSGLSTAVAGGILVIIYMLIKGGFKETLVNALGLFVRPLFRFIYMVSGKKWFLDKQEYFMDHKKNKQNEYVPYAIAISVGTLVVLFFGMENLIRF